MLKTPNDLEMVGAPAAVDDRNSNSLLLQQFLDEIAECLVELCTLGSRVRQESTQELLSSTNWNELSDHWVAVEGHLRDAIETYGSQFAPQQTDGEFKSGEDS